MNDWNYAELSKSAKDAGGPEKFVELLEQSSRQQGRKEMLPWIAVISLGASLFTVGLMKINNDLKTRKESKKKEIKKIETKLIEEIEEYDSKNTSEEGGVDDEREISEC